MNTKIIDYSNDLIVECKRIVRECIVSSSLNINCDDIEKCIHEEIDTEAFMSWFNFNLNKFKDKSNQHSYFKKSFLNELEKGTFKVKARVEYVPNAQVLINELRDKGVCVLAEESVWISVVWRHLINVEGIDLTQCQLLNHKILDLMKDSKSFSDYKNLLMNSNYIKQFNINWKLLDEKAKMENLGWDKYLESLESEE